MVQNVFAMGSQHPFSYGVSLSMIPLIPQKCERWILCQLTHGLPGGVGAGIVNHKNFIFKSLRVQVAFCRFQEGSNLGSFVERRDDYGQEENVIILPGFHGFSVLKKRLPDPFSGIPEAYRQRAFFPTWGSYGP